jgi:hypothetical protein
LSRRGDIATTLIAAAAFSLAVICVAAQWMIASGGIPRGSLLLERTEGQVVWAWGSSEGDQSIPVGPASEAGGILLALPEASESIIVLINGEAVADFRYMRAAVVVHRGDLVEIDAGHGLWGNGPDAAQLQVEIVDTTPNVLAPQRGVYIRLSPGRTAIANIEM